VHVTRSDPAENRRLSGGAPRWVPAFRQRARSLILLLGVLAVPALGATAFHPPDDAERVSVDHRNTEHTYRIIGRIRLLLVWTGADDVGGARITWRGDTTNQTLALLIGSDPRRAPRRVNEWGYVREEMTAEATNVFGIRTAADGESPDDAEARQAARGELVQLGVLCSNVSPAAAASRTTTVRVAKDATYHDVDRVLDVVEQTSAWKDRRTIRPANVAPGFLTALDRMMRASASQADATPTSPGISYVYRDAVYDLTPRRVDRVPLLRTRSTVYRNLLRSDIAVRNRATGFTTSFSITYGADGPLAGVPVAARYQPNWWFKIELELDDGQEVPPDPAADPSIGRRIAQLCMASD